MSAKEPCLRFSQACRKRARKNISAVLRMRETNLCRGVTRNGNFNDPSMRLFLFPRGYDPELPERSSIYPRGS